MSVKIEDKESIEYWRDRCVFLESVIEQLRAMVKDQSDDETTRIARLEIGLAEIYKIVEWLVNGE